MDFGEFITIYHDFPFQLKFSPLEMTSWSICRIKFREKEGRRGEGRIIIFEQFKMRNPLYSSFSIATPLRHIYTLWLDINESFVHFHNFVQRNHHHSSIEHIQFHEMYKYWTFYFLLFFLIKNKICSTVVFCFLFY